MAAKSKDAQATKVVSYRVSLELHDTIESYAKTQKDEAGLPLNVHTAARRLMLQSLQVEEKKDKPQAARSVLISV